MSGSENALLNTPLAHHQKGNEYCPYCDRSELVFPLPCHCGGLLHRQGDIADDSPDRYLTICDKCGARNHEEEIFV